MAGRQDDFKPRPGWQGSETTGVEVYIHHQGGDPIVIRGEAMGFQRHTHGPRSNIESAVSSLIAVNTFKSIGVPSGSFTLTAKSFKATSDYYDLFDQIVDDDWLDIVFTRHGRKYHTMRGLIDEVRRSRVVGGTGATSTVFTITGRDFGKIWEQTPVWFSPQANENIHGHVAAKVFTSRADQEDSTVAGDSLVLESPAAAVRGYLFGFLEELAGTGRANWNPPRTLPNITNGSFLESVYLNTDRFQNVPSRRGIDPNFIMAGGTLWDLAKEWSDPMFTELFVDLLPDGDPGYAGRQQGEELSINDTRMTVVYRDKPFPIADPLDIWTGEKGLGSPWYQLPVYVIPREAITNLDVGRSGAERFNAFFITSPLHQEALGINCIDIVAPLWDKDDIFRHGLRRFDVSSKYSAAGAELLNMVEQQRVAIRDWYAINPYLFNGNLEVGIGLPDIRVGMRARVPGARSQDEDETYYVETVSQNWSFGPGLKTSLGVTRGWRGTDESLLEAVRDIAFGYVVEPTARPLENTVDASAGFGGVVA